MADLSLPHPGIPKLGTVFSSTRIHPGIERRKSAMLEKGRDYLLEQLASHSPCGTVECKCIGWKPVDPTKEDCADCDHGKAGHIVRYKDLPEIEIKRLFGLVFDSETLRVSIAEEQHEIVKTVFTQVRACMLKAAREIRKLSLVPVIGPRPVFRNSLQAAIKAILRSKYGKDPTRFGDLVVAARDCVSAMSLWRIDPAIASEKMSPHGFKVWMALCYIPAYCSSMDYLNAASVFGRQFFVRMFGTFRSEVRKLLKEREGTGEKKGGLVAPYNANRYIPPASYAAFMDAVSAELDDENSSAWAVTEGPGDPDSQMLGMLVSDGVVPPYGRRLIEDKMEEYIDKLTPAQKQVMTPRLVASLRRLYVRQFKDNAAIRMGMRTKLVK